MMKKIVDGKIVLCSRTEEQEILAEWASNDPASKGEILRKEAEIALAYLNETDYKVLRVEEGYVLDIQLVTDRETAREKIRAYEQYQLSTS